MISLCRSLTFYLFFFPHCKTSGNYGWSDRGGPSLKDLLLGRFLLCHKKNKKSIKDHLPSQHILSFFLFVLKCHYFGATIIICVPLSVSSWVWLCFCSRVPGEGFSGETSGCNLPLTYWSGMLLASVNKMSLWWVQFPTGWLKRESKP